MALIYVINPFIFGKLNQIPENIVEKIAVIVALMFLTDLIISFNVISNVRKATKRFDKENPRTQISTGDVILGIIGGSIGNTAIYEHDEPVIAQRSIAIFGSLLNNRYMKLLLDSPLFQQQFASKSNGTAQGGIYLGELANMLVPLPPENEQNRILISVNVLENQLASM